MYARLHVFSFLFLCHQVYFGMLDALLASEELPVEYRDRCQVKHSDFFFPSKSLITLSRYHCLLSVKATNLGIYRIYCAMTVIRRGQHPSTGCTTSVGLVDPIIPE